MMTEDPPETVESTKTAEEDVKMIPMDQLDNIEMGGRVDPPAYALLDGFAEDLHSGKYVRKRFPLTTIPQTLGRVDLGSNPRAISRQHFRIDFYKKKGVRMVQKEGTDEFEEVKEEKLQMLHNHSKVPLSGPFYTITVLGKNKIMVNGKPAETGETCTLKNKVTLRFASFMMYFFHHETAKKRRASDASGEAPAAKRQKGSLANFQLELDELTNKQVLQRFNEAMEDPVWGRHSQMIGTNIGLRAAIALANDAELRKEEAVTKATLLEWIANSPEYGDWSIKMLQRVEAKSYQANLTKCLVKVGFTSGKGQGRYTKWYLPTTKPQQLGPNGGTSSTYAAAQTVNKPKQEQSASASSEQKKDQELTSKRTESTTTNTEETPTSSENADTETQAVVKPPAAVTTSSATAPSTETASATEALTKQVETKLVPFPLPPKNSQTSAPSTTSNVTTPSLSATSSAFTAVHPFNLPASPPNVNRLAMNPPSDN